MEFKNADLGVFDDIAGILASTGEFEGTLESIEVTGRASVPDFPLKSARTPVPPSTRFNVDLHGTLKLQAKVSETMTGWKRWVLKPVDPFFSKQGAGTLLHIQVTGTSKDPKFGRERGKKDEAAPTMRAKPEPSRR